MWSKWVLLFVSTIELSYIGRSYVVKYLLKFTNKDAKTTPLE